MAKKVNVGLIGFGTVGTGVARLLFGSDKPFTRGRNFDIEIVRIADLDMETDRGISVPVGILTNNAEDILNDPEIDIVVELIGGYEPARTITLKAFEKGKSVVTANKALIAKHGCELFQAADKANVYYMFEASVGGGIPVIRNFSESLNANNILSIYGILNGTTNYILTGMSRDGLDYDDVLVRAQKRGFAEANPHSDVSGEDSLNKLVILVRLAFGINMELDKVYCEGIENITIQDIEYAKELDYTVKLLAIAKKRPDNRVEARIHPTLVPSDSIMASVEDEFNAIEIYGDSVGREIFFGKGAGMMPTASAVVSDVVDICSRIVNGTPSDVRRNIINAGEKKIIPLEELELKYFIHITVRNRPGVLAKIANAFADKDISIESVFQKSASAKDFVPLIIMTQFAKEGDVQSAIRKISSFDVVERVKLIRIEEFLTN